jgi:Fic family protein
MDRDYFVKLTTNLYRLTLLFPKKEPLRYRLRELADIILANSVLILEDNPVESKKLILENDKNLVVLNTYLELAKSQNWVSPFDILEIQKEYAKIKSDLRKDVKPIRVSPPKVISSAVFEKKEGGRESRQQKILEVIENRGKVQVGDLKKVLANVSKRTLRRDFDFLIKQGLVERVGEKNDTFYQLIDRT